MKKAGFSFLELIIGISIASMLSILLFTAYNQITKSTFSLTKIINLDTRVLILQSQLNRDISGIFVPDITPVKAEEKKQKNGKEKKENENDDQNAKEVKEIKEEAQRKFYQKTFYAENSLNTIKELTFITCNPLEIYGQTKPRIARVTYNLKEDKFSKGSYILTRQESMQLDYSKSKDSIEYELVNNIKDLRFEFIVPEETKQDKDKEKEEKAKEKKYKIYNEWRFEDNKKQKDSSMIPMFMNAQVTFWEDVDHTQEQKFEFKYIIYAFDSQYPKKKRINPLEDFLTRFDKLRSGLENKDKDKDKQANQKTNNKNEKK